MYMKNLNHKMTLRLTDELKEYVDMMATAYSISPSDFIRQCVYNTKVAQERAEKILKDNMNQETLESIAKELKEGFANGIDHKTNQHDSI